MRYRDFYMREHGFVGHMAEPDDGSDRAVIIVMGGEQSILPGIKFAETVCLLSKGDVKSQKLRVEFSLEDMDTDGFKKGGDL